MVDTSWQWLWDFEDQAHADEDAARIRLSLLYQRAEIISHESPDEKIALYEAGRDLARQLGERWWEMFYEHWVIEVLLFGKNQPQFALDRAARAVFETSKPEFAAFPQRLNLQLNLVAAYIGIDPIGYETELRNLLAHIEASCEPLSEDFAYCMQLASYFRTEIEDASAIEMAYRYLQAAEITGSDHYISDALTVLCIALVRFDADAARVQLGDLAALGEELSRREEHTRSVTELLMWRAVAARWNGEESSAKRFYRQALALQMRLAPPQNCALAGAILFHEAGGEGERALEFCQMDIRLLRAHKLTFMEARQRLKQCQLLKAMGRDFSKSARRLRRVAAKLRSKSHWEAKISALEATDGAKTL